MLQMGLGMQSLRGLAKGGFVLGIVIEGGVEVLDYIFKDEKTMYDLVGGIGVEAVKAGLATAVGYGVAAGGVALAGAFGVTTVVAVLPLVVMVVVVVGVAIALNTADNHYKIKESVVAALKQLPEHAESGMYRAGTAFDSAFKDWIRLRYR